MLGPSRKHGVFIAWGCFLLGPSNKHWQVGSPQMGVSGHPNSPPVTISLIGHQHASPQTLLGIFSPSPPPPLGGGPCGLGCSKNTSFSKKIDENFGIQVGRIWVWGVIICTQKRSRTYFEAGNRSGPAPLNQPTTTARAGMD